VAAVAVKSVAGQLRVAGDQLVPSEEDRGRKLLDLSAKYDRAADVEMGWPCIWWSPTAFRIHGLVHT